MAHLLQTQHVAVLCSGCVEHFDSGEWVSNLVSNSCRAEVGEAQQREQASAQQAAQLSADIEALQVCGSCVITCKCLALMTPLVHSSGATSPA